MARVDQPWRDFLLITLAIGGLFGALFLYSGVWPPVVTVETSSMMHVDRTEYFSGSGDTRAEDVSFGRLGTMDPGDLVIVKEIESIDDVVTYAEAEGGSYGDKGDVVAYRLITDGRERAIVHRAMTYVEIEGTVQNPTYRVLWSEDWEEQGDCVSQPVYVCTFGTEGVTIEEIGLVDKAFTQGGFITKGDNVASNPGADQAGEDPLAPQPIRVSSLIGEAQGEIPSIGLLRVAFSGTTIRNAEMQGHSYWLRIGNVVAPLDLWGVVLAEMVALAVAPLFISVGREVLRGSQRRTTEELGLLEESWRKIRGPGRGP